MSSKRRYHTGFPDPEVCGNSWRSSSPPPHQWGERQKDVGGNKYYLLEQCLAIVIVGPSCASCTGMGHGHNMSIFVYF
eukprot:scaffold2006_cov141-Isochrysis_galbana.AAC.9